MFVLFLHVPESFASRYVGKDTPHAMVRFPWLGGQYTTWAQERSLREVLAEHGFTVGPVVLVGWSAGCFAIRQWLRDASNRELVSGAVLLDGLHSAGPPCREEAVEPLVEFARMGKPLAVTASLIVPGSYASAKDCLDLLRARLPEGANVRLEQAKDSDHVAQVRDVGPPLLQWVLDHPGPAPYRPWLVALGGAALGVTAALLVRRTGWWRRRQK